MRQGVEIVEKSKNGFPDFRPRRDQQIRAGFWDARRTAVA
jgi:hypothetical protein